MRVFFALWPDAPIRARLDAAAAALHAHHGGGRTRADTIHLTLVFLGEIAAEQLPAVMQAAASVTAAPCSIELDRIGCWRHNRIAHLGCSVTPPPLRDLVSQLEARIAAVGVNFDRRRYVPHVTLLRKADCAASSTPPGIAPIPWEAKEFVLVRSHLGADGARYETLGRWKL